MIRDYSQLQICNASSSAYLSFVSYGRRPSTVHSSLENVCRLISNTACECHEWFLMAIYLARRVFSVPLQLIFQRARSVVAVSGSLAQRGIANFDQ